MKRKKSFSWKVNENGIGLLPFLQKNLETAKSNRAIKRAIERNLCSVNSHVERFSTRRLMVGDLVTLESSWEEDRLAKVSCPVLFEDDFLVIINKLTGIESLDKTVSTILGQEVLLVHRLDKDTSGVLVCAKGESSFIALSELFANQEILKKYTAVTKGGIPKKRGVIKNFLGVKKRYQGQTIWGAVSNNGCFSHTEWSCIDKNDRGSLLEVSPITGRTHQIRVHLSEMGFPIFGDYHYDKRASSKAPRLMLHSHYITFIHPFTEQSVSVKAPVSKEMNLFCKHLRLSSWKGR